MRSMRDSKSEGHESAHRERKRVLLVAYHFPPDASSTGRLRTLAFAEHLPAFAWTPVVLSANAAAYEQIDPQAQAAIDSHTIVRRAFALDTRRHFGWRGKYLSWLAVPDRWIWWFPAAVATGLYLVRRQRINVIWSTFPIGTTHLIAYALKRLTGLPWVADFRDPVAPAGSMLQHRAARWIEKQTLTCADHVVFTTPGARRLYAQRFPQAQDRFSVIPNGYDEAIMTQIVACDRRAAGPCTLVHAGALYREGRDPLPFFRALARLRESGQIDSDGLRVVLRASGNAAYFETEVERLGLTEIVELAPAIGHKQALEEQAAADGLLLFQGAEFNAQIPAKVYEYYRLGKPIIALTDAKGDTAQLLMRMGGSLGAPLDDENAIATLLAKFLSDWRADRLETANMSDVHTYSRQAGAKRLGRILDQASAR